MMMSGNGGGGNMIAVSGGLVGGNSGQQGSANEGLSEKMAISAIQKSLMLCEKAVKSPPQYPTPMVHHFSLKMSNDKNIGTCLRTFEPINTVTSNLDQNIIQLKIHLLLNYLGQNNGHQLNKFRCEFFKFVLQFEFFPLLTVVIFLAAASADVPDAGSATSSSRFQPAVSDAAAWHAERCSGSRARPVCRPGHRAGQPSRKPGQLKSSQFYYKNSHESLRSSLKKCVLF